MFSRIEMIEQETIHKERGHPSGPEPCYRAGSSSQAARQLYIRGNKTCIIHCIQVHSDYSLALPCLHRDWLDVFYGLRVQWFPNTQQLHLLQIYTLVDLPGSVWMEVYCTLFQIYTVVDLSISVYMKFKCTSLSKCSSPEANWTTLSNVGYI